MCKLRKKNWPEKEEASKLVRAEGMGPSNLLLDKLTSFNPSCSNLGIWPWNSLFCSLNSINLGKVTKAAGMEPVNLLLAKWSFFNDSIPLKASPGISPENLLFDKNTVLSAPNRLNSGKEPSKSLFMKLTLLKSRNLANVLTSIAPCNPMPSSWSPQTWPFSHNTPVQPLHGGFDTSQFDNLAVFLRDCRNLSKISASEDWANEETEKSRRRRRRRRKKHVVDAMVVVVRARVCARPAVGHLKLRMASLSAENEGGCNEIS